MAKKMLIDATHAEETRVVVVDGNKVEEFDFETINKRQLAGNIYLAKVTRVEPSLQAAFVDYGGNRHGFLAFAEIHPDYYQIPVADRQALIEEERAYAEREEAEENGRPRRRSGAGSGGGSRSAAPKPERAAEADAVTRSEDIPGMGVVDLEAEPDEAVVDAAPLVEPAAPVANGNGNGEEAEAYVAADHASETDDEIESVADEDLSDEIQAQRKPRPRRYKIQEVVKVRQIMLVQVVKEERGNKGAALTTYLSLAGRYCVLMPNTARGGGISRKITNIVDRKKLKEIAGEMEVPQGAGLIIRTAGSQRTRTEIRRDYEYLMRLWEQIRDLTLRSIAPAPVYEEGDLIKRSIRDLYSKEIDEVLVEGDRGYRTAKDFMKMIMPSHAKNVKHYADQLPLFARFGVESYLGAMFNPTVQLKSGGYIVIGITEALVAIDVNSGRSTKEGSIEDTALKTNLEAAEEIARQLRLRDLAGLIVIDFIDMEERRNNASVEKRLKEKLKTDRARIQVGRISGFGLLEMSRQRLRPGMIEMTTQPCPHCHGTGVIRSDDSMALQILRQIEEEGTRKRSREVLVKAPVAVANYLMNAKRDHIAGIEARYGLSVRIEADPDLISPDFTLEKFKTATRNVPEVTHAVAAADPRLMAEIDEEDEDIAEDVEEAEEAAEAPAPKAAAIASGDEGPKKKKRRRRRKKKPESDAGANGDLAEAVGDEDEDEGDEPLAAAELASPGVEAPLAPAAEGDTPVTKPPRTSRRSRSSRSNAGAAVAPVPAAEVAETAAETAAEADAKQPSETTAEAPKKTSSRVRKPRAKAETAVEAAPAPAPAKPPRSRSTKARPAAEPAPAEAPEATAEPAAEPAAEPLQVAKPPEAATAPVPQPPLDPVPAPEAEAKPKRRGWWSLAR
jgi:ribonuclease E